MSEQLSNEYEAALPNLIEKLKELQAILTPDELAVFTEIIESAAIHTEFVMADDEGRHDKKLYMKPQSSHASTSMKEIYLRLPSLLGTKPE